MAVIDKILGDNLQFIVNGVLVGCAESGSIDISAKELAASCTGSGNLEQAVPGRKKVTWDVAGLFKETSGDDIVLNKTVQDFFANVMGNQEVTVVFGASTPGVGYINYVGEGYVKNLKLNATVDEIGKYTISGWFNALTTVTGV
jgi:hypothetical protein